MLTKKKIILMLGFVLCAVALLFCFSQTALADTGDNDNNSNNCTGYVVFLKSVEQFDDIDKLIDIIDQHEDDTIQYEINLDKDLDFKGNTINIYKGHNVTFNLKSHKVYSNERDSMFEVEGKLHIIGNGENHGQFVSNNGHGYPDHPSIIAGNGGIVDAHDVDFIVKYLLIKYEKCTGGHDYKFENCNFISTKEGMTAIQIDDCTQVESLTPFTFQNCKFKDFGVAIKNKCKKTILNILSCEFKNNINSMVCEKCNESQYIINDTIFDSCGQFDGMTGGSDGAAIRVYGDKYTFTFNNSKITNCSAETGPALYIVDGKDYTFSFNNSYIEKCKASSSCGAIYCGANNVNFNFKDSSIKNCKAGGDGGAFFVKGHDVKIDGSKDFFNTGKIEGCHADGCGGAIYTSFETNCGNNVTISNFDFIGNSSDDEGGAIKTKGKYNIIKHCNFKDNSSKNEGGAVYGYGNCLWGQDTETQLKYCEFSNNTTTCGKSKSIYLDYWRTCHVQLNLLYYKGDSCDMYTETNINKKKQNYKDFIGAIKVS